MGYIDLLRESAEKAGCITCMGLDPQLELMPGSDPARDKINSFYEKLFRRMRLEGVVPAAFKPNIGFYASLDNPRGEDFSGSCALADVMDMLENFFPGIPVILDSKRGDIARSSKNYAVEAFDKWRADAVTVSPYMGTDSVMPFAYEDKGVYILNRTSNPGAAVLQNMLVVDRVDEKDMYPLYLAVAHTIYGFANEHHGIGAVVGATNMQELDYIADYFCDKDIPMLIPGVGAQGGSAEEVMAALRKNNYDVRLARINSSSGLTSPWKKGQPGDDWLDQCMAAIKDLNGKTAL